jgi:FKBP-type peptidyl-prolyl cis-trans isomerase
MKPYVSPVLFLGLFAAAATLSAQEVKLNVPAAPASSAAAATTPATPAITEAQILEFIGWALGRQSQLETFDFTAAQLSSVFKGMELAAADKEFPLDLEKIGPDVDAFVQKRQDSYVAKQKAKAEAEATAHFAKLRTTPGVQFTPSGLGYEIMKPGTGAYPKATDTVSVLYKGTLLTGEVFDSNMEAPPGGQVEPIAVELTGGVLDGWKEGLQKINKGGRIKLHIPAKLAYGDEGNRGIAPGTALIFEIELVDFRATPGPASIGPTLPPPAVTK